MSSSLSILRGQIVAHLKAQPWAVAHGIEVIERKPASTAAALRTATASLKAPGVLVFLPTIRAVDANLPFEAAHDIAVELQVIEVGSLNRSGVEADEVALWCLKALHHWTPDGASCPLYMDAAPLEPGEATDPYVINVLLSTTGALE